jgi:predicted AAA+ superfamily ATPase
VKRDALKQLIQWSQKDRHKPLILQGARQVGKTWLLREFGRLNFKNVAYCNFERDQGLGELFERSLSPHKIIPLLGAFLGIEISPSNTLIIFDEIQECGAALTSLKYFFEDAPEYFVAAAGSLLGVTLAKSSSFPVGSVEFLDLYPLSFAEFVSANNKEQILQQLQQYDLTNPIPTLLSNELLELLAVYQVVGGMPEAIDRFLVTRSYEVVRTIQDSILKSYVNDFAKHAPRNLVGKILSVWEVVPTILGRENKKFNYSVIKSGARASEYEEAITWLVQAQVLRKVRRVTSPALPIRERVDSSSFKLYLNDVGLLSSLMGVSSSLIVSPEKLLGEYSGAIAECFVAEELAAMGCESLYYWTSTGEAEVDFIVDAHSESIAIEVKAGSHLRSKSLTVFVEKYKALRVLRFSLQNLNKAGAIENYPLYAIRLASGVLGRKV